MHMQSTHTLIAFVMCLHAVNSRMHICIHAGVCPAPPGLIKRGTQFINGIVGGGIGGVVNTIGYRTRSIRKVVWRVEDIAIAGSKLAAKVAVKAVRPLVIGGCRLHGSALISTDVFMM